MHQSGTPTTAARGFTLVEILVGLVLGMIAIIIMYQVFATFEGQRRTTVGAADAQSAGHLSMYLMEREVRLAGLGLMYLYRADADKYEGQLACPGGIASYSAKGGGVTKAGGIPAVPLLITDGGAGSDRFTVTFSHSAEAGAPNKLVVALEPSGANALSTGIKVSAAPFATSPAEKDKNAVFQKGDFILVGQPGLKKHCVRLKLTSVEPDVLLGSAEAPMTVLKAATSEDENPADGAADFIPSPIGYTVDPSAPSFVMRLGAAAVKEYRVNANQQLTVGLPDDPAPTPIAEGVVSLQVMYGVGPKAGDKPSPTSPETCDADGLRVVCQSIKAWTSAAAYDGVDWDKLNAVPGNLDQRLTDIKRIKAVRIAVVTRSQNLERDVLYGATAAIQPKATCTAGGDVVDVAGTLRVCAWADGANPDGTTHTAPRVDLTGMADWDRYRYKVYETVIPMRNVIWGSKGS
ncbi:MAG: PilW family protein [Bacteroidota bacterium]